ncbi:MAG TPA: c-type cytochrome [Alloacidobacterium sp.]|nr:c-type cytochrome [Alloacidobacterium sp.]
MRFHALAGCVLLLAISGCTQLPGAPKPGVEVPRPGSVLDFATLYGQNCAGCHGNNGRNGAALDLANPDYQSLVDDATLRKIIANGEPGTQMPAFARSAGGFLTDDQVDALVRGLRTSWPVNSGTSHTEETPPPYSATLKGDVAHGQQVYQTACVRCHQQPSENILSPTYLALVTDQTLRTLVIAGRPDIGQPNWTGDIPGHALTDQEVTDVVAWLASQRIETPGQPYPHPQ